MRDRHVICFTRSSRQADGRTQPVMLLPHEALYA